MCNSPILSRCCTRFHMQQLTLLRSYLSKFNEKTLLFNKYFQFLRIIPRFILIYPPLFDQFFYITALAGGCSFHFKGGLFLLCGIICCSKKQSAFCPTDCLLQFCFLQSCFLQSCFLQYVILSSSVQAPRCPLCLSVASRSWWFGR